MTRKYARHLDWGRSGDALGMLWDALGMLADDDDGGDDDRLSFLYIQTSDQPLTRPLC